MAGKKDALIPRVYNLQTTRESTSGGTATFVLPLDYRDGTTPTIQTITFTRAELHEYFQLEAGKQAGLYVFYVGSGDAERLLASCTEEAVESISGTSFPPLS